MLSLCSSTFKDFLKTNVDICTIDEAQLHMQKQLLENHC